MTHAYVVQTVGCVTRRVPAVRDVSSEMRVVGNRDLQLQHVRRPRVTGEVAFHPGKSVLNFLHSVF